VPESGLEDLTETTPAPAPAAAPVGAPTGPHAPAALTAAPRPGESPGAASEARFVSGSTLRHVAVMTATGAVGLMAVFAVDLLSLLYVARLGDPRLTAAVGFASVIQFFAVSVNVGLMIAVGALVSRSIGAGDRPLARRLAGSACALLVVASILVVAAMLPALHPMLGALGADAETADLAHHFLLIALPSNPLMALGMAYTGALRAVGDASRAMIVTLAGAIVTAGLDPILIFGLDMGLTGAAVSIVAARVVFVLVGWHGAVTRHDLVARPRPAEVVADADPILRIAVPAVLTSLAPAVAGAFFAGVLARHGTAVVAANAIVDRLVPVAFGGLFALSGAVGPILGQNWGAGRFDRMRATLRDAARFAAGYVAVVWLVLALGRGLVAQGFGVEGEAADLVRFFCLVGGGLWFFNGLLFVANAAFNNLGFPLLSTLFNWGRATLGTVPFALAGAALAGPKGAFLGVGAGSVIFGSWALAEAFRRIAGLAREGRRG
jgi:putative MATE family efflux protein